MIETDWSVATFTMNWKLTRPHWPVTFEIGEPICMVVPQRRGELESFHPQSLCRLPPTRTLSAGTSAGWWTGTSSTSLCRTRSPMPPNAAGKSIIFRAAPRRSPTPQSIRRSSFKAFPKSRLRSLLLPQEGLKNSPGRRSPASCRTACRLYHSLSFLQVAVTTGRGS